MNRRHFVGAGIATFVSGFLPNLPAPAHVGTDLAFGCDVYLVINYPPGHMEAELICQAVHSAVRQSVKTAINRRMHELRADIAAGKKVVLR